ncbi:hypothetical protein FOL47_009732 [Perkinsus chesapeaki]|uniref:Uncharacterized protein n=1 Tax=Perkinsus chesapeaki TaxID=330153 RepID=A0A7J6N4F5_PERCH|nr:hypothetical protein FOL47_009732 [Perkinsus chesapeaki]
MSHLKRADGSELPKGLSALYKRFSQSSYSDDDKEMNKDTDDLDHLKILLAIEASRRKKATHDLLKMRRAHDQQFLEEQRVKRAVFEEKDREVTDLLDELHRLKFNNQTLRHKLQSREALRSASDYKKLVSECNRSSSRTSDAAPSKSARMAKEHNTTTESSRQLVRPATREPPLAGSETALVQKPHVTSEDVGGAITVPKVRSTSSAGQVRLATAGQEPWDKRLERKVAMHRKNEELQKSIWDMYYIWHDSFNYH